MWRVPGGHSGRGHGHRPLGATQSPPCPPQQSCSQKEAASWSQLFLPRRQRLHASPQAGPLLSKEQGRLSKGSLQRCGSGTFPNNDRAPEGGRREKGLFRDVGLPATPRCPPAPRGGHPQGPGTAAWPQPEPGAPGLWILKLNFCRSKIIRIVPGLLGARRRGSGPSSPASLPEPRSLGSERQGQAQCSGSLPATEQSAASHSWPRGGSQVAGIVR